MCAFEWEWSVCQRSSFIFIWILNGWSVTLSNISNLFIIFLTKPVLYALYGISWFSMYTYIYWFKYKPASDHKYSLSLNWISVELGISMYSVHTQVTCVQFCSQFKQLLKCCSQYTANFVQTSKIFHSLWQHLDKKNTIKNILNKCRVYFFKWRIVFSIHSNIKKIGNCFSAIKLSIYPMKSENEPFCVQNSESNYAIVSTATS